MAFGVSYLIDLYDCRPGSADDLELCYRFLERLIRSINMTPMSLPIVFHGPTGDDGEELYPDKAGISAWQPLIESGIQIHTIAPKNFITIDVYTCGTLDTITVLKLCKETFEFKKAHTQRIERGIEY